MFEDRLKQETNGEDHKLPPRGNTNPRFGSVLPSTSMLEFGDNLTQEHLAHDIRGLPAGIYQLGNHPKPGWIALGQVVVGHAIPGASATATPVIGLAPTSSAKAKDLELAGEVALFREIMEGWDFNDHQASAVLGYKEPTFAAELFKGLVSIRQRDAEERLHLVITIAIDLEALYRDHDVIRKWLRKPQELLGGATPLGVATEGTSLDLLKLSEYVEYLSGR
jgi:hypothetical protein